MELERRFRRWATAAGWAGAPLTADLLSHAAVDIAADGALRLVLRPFEDEPEWRELPLRLLARVHRWVLAGELPELARHCPTTGGDQGPEGAWPLFCRACVERAPEVQRDLAEPLRTEDVSRVAALTCGFLQLTWETARPLRLLEIGAGAGLELRWDHYRREPWLPGLFDRQPPVWGDVEIAERRGCDEAPIDPATDAGVLVLRSYVWPDQLDRLRILESALEVCRRVPAQVDQAATGRWLSEQLAELRSGTTTVVFRAAGSAYPSEALAEAAKRATDEAPLAWLRMEPTAGGFDVRLGMWPGGTDRLLATTDADHRSVAWIA